MKGKIFTAQEVQSIISGNKTQFREIAKIKFKSGINQNFTGLKPFKFGDEFRISGSTDEVCEPFKAPYQLGQKIFCKESFSYADKEWCDKTIFYKASHGDRIQHTFSVSHREKKWRSPMVMQEYDSRLTLEIKRIRVERLQDISKEDAIREGMFFTDYGKKCYHHPYQDIKICPSTAGHDNQEDGWNWKENKSPSECWGSAYWAFANRWNANHKNPEQKFDSNPWLWVVEFENINNKK